MTCRPRKNIGLSLILLTPLLFAGRAQAQALVFDDVAALWGLTFSDRSSEANLVEVAGWRHLGSADYDNDGWPDVGVGNKLGPNALYRNQQDGTFVDRAAQAGVLDPNDNFGMVFQDYDNDGFQDIYVAKYQLRSAGAQPGLPQQR